MATCVLLALKLKKMDAEKQIGLSLGLMYSLLTFLLFPLTIEAAEGVYTRTLW